MNENNFENNDLVNKENDNIETNNTEITNSEIVNDEDMTTNEGGYVSSDTFTKENLSENDILATKAAEEAIKQKKDKKMRLIRTVGIIIAIIVVVIVVSRIVSSIKSSNDEKKEIMKQVQTVNKMTISSELSGSGTLKPKDSYTITSLVEGEVKAVYFELGDKVVKGQLLLEIDSSSAKREITNASSSVIQARDSYNNAKYEYEKVVKDYEGMTFKAPYSGYLRTLSVKAGDTISSGTTIGTIVNDSVMSLKVPFLSNDAKHISTQNVAYIEIQETGELILGFVESVGEEAIVSDSGSLISYVNILVNNPGGLTENNTGIAMVNGFMSVKDASFKIDVNKEIKFEDGSNIIIESLLVGEGAYVGKGDAIFSITEDTFNKVLSSKKNAYLSAENALTKAESNYEDAIDTFDEYYITAPIDGTVITKDAKVGDKIQKSSSSAKTLCTIYDLSELYFEMDVDELDISKIKNGQMVNVKADAFNNRQFNGEITNISLVSSNSNGVTNYPVTVTVASTSTLLPGMNVDGYVILSKSEDTLGIPSGALQRGNVVYVENSSETITSKNYSIEGVSDRVKEKTPAGFTAVKVETGISNESYIEIKSGLTEGDKVYVSESTSNNTMNFGGFGGGGMGGPPPGGNR